MNTTEDSRYVFGPVPSRRLGLSLGIKNVPAKRCSYSCIYCQAGATRNMSVTRQSSYDLPILLRQVETSLEQAHKSSTIIDYISIVPDGEPTLDLNLANLLSQLKQFKIPLAIITNSSLINKPSVRAALCLADWVSVKVDSVTEGLWHSIDRPHGHLKLENLKIGLAQFAQEYSGQLVTETMVVKNYNDNESELRAIGKFLKQIIPSLSYLSIPIRPPVEKSVHPPKENVLLRCLSWMLEEMGSVPVELLNTHEDDAFATPIDDLEANIVAMTAVHPIRKEALISLLHNRGLTMDDIAHLFKSGTLIKKSYGAHMFIVNIAANR